ncbi:hypothetical protein GCM10022393_42650 [Aquimarina addita]|uniref:DUF4174 domain-containing protein n=1 Tax=Aquimarina addita TaxID=870485 RepID=A0ABP6UY02_9FLAO
MRYSFYRTHEGDPTMFSEYSPEDLISNFISSWYNLRLIKDLKKSILIVINEDKLSENYEDLIANGIHDDISSLLVFDDNKNSRIIFNERSSSSFELDYLLTIIDDWEVFLKKGVK